MRVSKCELAIMEKAPKYVIILETIFILLWIKTGLTLSLTALGQFAQHFFDGQNLTKNCSGKI
jgi:hypothetical protein